MGQLATTSEGRRHTRHEIELSVSWRRAAGDSVELHTVNVSESGALLQMAAGEPSGEQMDLIIRTPERDVQTSARVCYVGRVDDQLRVSVQFTEMSAEAAAYWKQWCAALKSPATKRNGPIRAEVAVVVLASALPGSALASLLDSGCRVSIVSDAPEALRTLSQGNTDVLISDVKRPDLDGRALCELVRWNPSLSGVQVILLACRGVKNPAQGLEVGATYVFTQPVEPAQLAAVISLLQRA